MSSGKTICVSGNPLGKMLEGLVSGALKPGTVVQVHTTALINGRPTFTVYNRAVDGAPGPLLVLTEDMIRTMTTAYASGDRCFVWAPLPGEEVNVLYKASAGAVTMGMQLIIDDGTGKAIPRPSDLADYVTGDVDTAAETAAVVNAIKNFPQWVPLTALEAISDPAEDTLLHCMVN